MPELLIELVSEEIPARMQEGARAAIARLLKDALCEAGLPPCEEPQSFVTPRRLTVHVPDLPDARPARTEERKGPRVGAPEAAIAGFLKANGLDSLEQANCKELSGVQYWFATRSIAAQSAFDLLPALIGKLILGFPWPRSMRWGSMRRGSGSLQWIRPLRGLLCLFGGKIVPCAIPLGGGAMLRAGDETCGHRFLAPDRFRVQCFAAYRDGLRERNVILDQAERRRIIISGLEEAAKREGALIIRHEGLFDELAGLVEWPVVLVGLFDEEFLDLPEELLTTSLRVHQRHVALRAPSGRLTARFCLVANMETADKGASIIAGNERVLRARLTDAQFFWDQDCARPLERFSDELASMTFHRKLGDMQARARRLAQLARMLAVFVPGCDTAELAELAELAERAGLLAKADLTTSMVGEFPELQGIMGGYYARASGEAPEVAEAITWQYRPAGQVAEDVPSQPVAMILGLADRLDLIVSLFAAGEAPTGSRDPFALRRAAGAIAAIIIENGLRLSLGACVDAALALIPEELADPGLRGRILGFIGERPQALLRRRGLRHDLIRAVWGHRGEDDLLRMVDRIEALVELIEAEDGKNLLIAHRRAANILRIEEKQ